MVVLEVNTVLAPRAAVVYELELAAMKRVKRVYDTKNAPRSYRILCS